MADHGTVAPSALPPEEVDVLLALDVPARLATFDGDGFPWITPLWFVWDGTAFHMTSVSGKRQLRNLARDRRTSILVDTEESVAVGGIRRNRQVKGKGHADVRPDVDGEWTRRITMKYVPGEQGRQLADRRARDERYLIRLEPGRLIAVGTLPPVRG